MPLLLCWCIRTLTCWSFVNLAPDPPQTPLLCRASGCPRLGRPSVYPETGTPMGCQGSERCCQPQLSSSLGRKSPCSPDPRSTEHDSPSQAAALKKPCDRSLCSPSPVEGARYPPTLNFHPWWILKCSFIAYFIGNYQQNGFWNTSSVFKSQSEPYDFWGDFFLEQSDLGIPQTGCSAGWCWPSGTHRECSCCPRCLCWSSVGCAGSKRKRWGPSDHMPPEATST